MDKVLEVALEAAVCAVEVPSRAGTRLVEPQDCMENGKAAGQ